MKNNLIFDFTVNKENNTVKVTRAFAADLDLVWDAWTKSEILDQWWGPKPWHVETKSMDFREGGSWLYAMIGPQNEKHWSRADYQNIEAKKSFSSLDAFCDENGKISADIPRSLWEHVFDENSGNTTVNILIQYQNPEHLEMMIKMGFKEGFTMGLQQLDEFLAANNK